MVLFYVVAAATAALGLLSLIVGPRRAWALWQRLGHALGDLVARVALTAFFVTIMAPFALITRALRDPLGTKPGNRAAWLPAEPVGGTLDDARRQF
jgi:hypothetical protein